MFGKFTVNLENLAHQLLISQHKALNLLKQEKTAKSGIRARQLQATGKEDYLLKVLAAGS